MAEAFMVYTIRKLCLAPPSFPSLWTKSGLTLLNVSSTGLCCHRRDILKQKTDCCPPLPSPNPPASSLRHSRQRGLSPFVTICMLLRHTMTIRTKIPLGFHCIVPMQCNLAAHRECSRKTAGNMVMGNHMLRLQESGVSLCTALGAKCKWDIYTCTWHAHAHRHTQRAMGIRSCRKHLSTAKKAEISSLSPRPLGKKGLGDGSCNSM